MTAVCGIRRKAGWKGIVAVWFLPLALATGLAAAQGSASANAHAATSSGTQVSVAPGSAGAQASVGVAANVDASANVNAALTDHDHGDRPGGGPVDHGHNGVHGTAPVPEPPLWMGLGLLALVAAGVLAVRSRRQRA